MAPAGQDDAPISPAPVQPDHSESRVAVLARSNQNLSEVTSAASGSQGAEGAFDLQGAGIVSRTTS